MVQTLTVALHCHLKDNVAEAGVDVCPHQLVDFDIAPCGVLDVPPQVFDGMKLITVVTYDVVR